MNDSFQRVAADVKMGRDVRLYGFVNLYGCEIGDEVKIGTFVEIQKGAVIGNRCKISSHSFICEGVEIADEVFIGHGVMLTNDSCPRARPRRGTRRLPGIGKSSPPASTLAPQSAAMRRSFRASA